MHEYSIVQALLDQCETYAKANDAEKITRIEIKVGVMSGVEPHLLSTAFETFREKTVCDGAELVVQIQPIVVTCRNCQATSTLRRIHYCCPQCESTDVRVDEGEDLMLMQLEME